MNIADAHLRVTVKGEAALILNRIGVPLSDELSTALDQILALAWDEAEVDSNWRRNPYPRTVGEPS